METDRRWNYIILTKYSHSVAGETYRLGTSRIRICDPLLTVERRGFLPGAIVAVSGNEVRAFAALELWECCWWGVNEV
ncbi:MAG TPA: hypothetical protein DDW51_07795 [Cyanobacteria bacterium UBA11367]|nr:hypothetical protein [Cyanobacteria bacterium UBA11367]HBS68163.1 hypothetical protein [Cyanobacteria bacterium UBA11153]